MSAYDWNAKYNKGHLGVSNELNIIAGKKKSFLAFICHRRTDVAVYCWDDTTVLYFSVLKMVVNLWMRFLCSLSHCPKATPTHKEVLVPDTGDIWARCLLFVTRNRHAKIMTRIRKVFSMNDRIKQTSRNRHPRWKDSEGRDTKLCT